MDHGDLGDSIHRLSELDEIDAWLPVPLLCT